MSLLPVGGAGARRPQFVSPVWRSPLPQPRPLPAPLPHALARSLALVAVVVVTLLLPPVAHASQAGASPSPDGGVLSGVVACPEGVPVDSRFRRVEPHAEVYGAAPAPRYTHVSPIREDASSALSFIWLTDPRTLASEVQMGTSPDRLRTVAQGISFSYRGLDQDPPRRVHEVHVCGLPASTELFYRVGGPGRWSETFRIRTLPAPGGDEPVLAIVAGDSRSNNRGWAQVASRIAAERPDVVFFSGDIVGDGRVKTHWENWFTGGADMLANTLFVPVVGNHEYGALHYDAFFGLPGDEHNFVVRFGQVAFVGFNDQDSPEGLRTNVRPRVERLLAEASDAGRVMMMNHEPWYSSGRHGSDRHLRAAMLDLLDRYTPDVVFNGHDHNYERSVRIRGDAQVADGAPGTTYVVSAGAGANLCESGHSWFTVLSRSTFHYVRMRIAGTSVQLEAVDMDGEVFDRYTLPRRITP